LAQLSGTQMKWIVVALLLSGCAGQAQLGQLGTTVTQVGESPVAICTPIMLQAASSLAALKQQLNGTVPPLIGP
jgi:outer membrane murein-binding lipoprotein Lpp